MSIIIKPIITEKVANQNEKGFYGFVVSKSANKVQIRQVIEKTYGVKVVSVNTINSSVKRISRFTKSGLLEGQKSSIKKAIIKVADGEVIDYYGNL